MPYSLTGLYDLEVAEKDIIEWMYHILRGVQQEKAKKSAMDNLKSNPNHTGFWLSDYAQKVLPIQFREAKKVCPYMLIFCYGMMAKRSARKFTSQVCTDVAKVSLKLFV